VHDDADGYAIYLTQSRGAFRRAGRGQSGAASRLHPSLRSIAWPKPHECWLQRLRLIAGRILAAAPASP
jgi:hypothetical protein